MFDRKSLANELLALRKSSLAIGNENQTLADAIERILTQLEGDGAPSPRMRAATWRRR